MKPNDRNSNDAPPGQKRSHSSPSLIQTGHMAMLLAIFLSVAPGIVDGPGALGIGFVGIIFYAVEALGAVYDHATATVREVRA